MKCSAIPSLKEGSKEGGNIIALRGLKGGGLYEMTDEMTDEMTEVLVILALDDSLSSNIQEAKFLDNVVSLYRA